MSDQITIYRLDENKHIHFPIVPLKLERQWMSNTREKFAYKCLPLGIANSYGWMVLSPADFAVSWHGGNIPQSIVVESPDEYFVRNLSHSIFGDGIVTLQLDFIIRTPENHSVYIRGIPNDDDFQNIIAKPLDAIVETDWLPFTFTYNFKFMHPGTVIFRKGQPLFSFFVIERNTTENLEIVEDHLSSNEELMNDYRILYEQRNEANSKQTGFMKFYSKAESDHKKFNVTNHIKKLIFKTPKRSDKIE